MTAIQGQRGALAQPMSLPKPRQHVIAAGPRYEPGNTDYDAAPMECACGWSGKAGDFAAHRLEQGQLTQRKANGSRVLAR